MRLQVFTDFSIWFSVLKRLKFLVFPVSEKMFLSAGDE